MRTKKGKKKLRTCPHCEGKRTEVVGRTFFGGGDQTIQACSICKGKGSILAQEKSRRTK